MTVPVDFVVLGVPASSQAGAASKTRWKAKVATAARDALAPLALPTEEDVEIVIVYFHEDAPLDVDNMIKPIQDALCGVVYKDDSQVSDTRGSRRDLDGRYEVRAYHRRLLGAS